VDEFEQGIPRLAALISSNETFCLFRGFFPYACRILLHREIELEQLVKRLHQLDASDAANPEMMYRLSGVDLTEGLDPEQKELLQQIEIKIREYCETKDSQGIMRSTLVADWV
jgi:hypothetical protein